jgi:hypothetical protein
MNVKEALFWVGNQQEGKRMMEVKYIQSTSDACMNIE